MNLLPMENPSTINIGENIAYIERELIKAKKQQEESDEND